ncbi:MAG: nucleotidyltransferase domain-containing protein [Candidatus Eremiobacteraeota bacterium]|nr:nucleotidyltransferase domain-containing protein [Candidatus Eremiobacteraeota bacterium]
MSRCSRLGQPGLGLQAKCKKVVVFGSVARQQAGPDSDLDLCGLVDKVDPLLHERLFGLLPPGPDAGPDGRLAERVAGPPRVGRR